MSEETRIPNTHSPEEVRRAFAGLHRKTGILDDGAAGEVLVGTAVGSLPAWGTELTALTKVTVDNITIDGAVISSDTGAISFVDENLTTTGTVAGINVTSGNDPGHTHTERFFHNGTFWESFNALVSSDGATITLTLQQTPTGDLTMQFSDGETVLDCTDPAQTIVLTAGDDDAPRANYIYIPQSTKVLTKSTSSWPATEHIKVAYCLVPSATFVNDHAGPYVNQNWNDFLQGTDSQGHLSHIAKKIRRLGASWFSGVNADGGTVSYFTIGSGTTKWISTTGVVMQLHEQTFPIVDMTSSDLAIVVNDNSAAYTHVTDLFSITQDNTGTPITNNRYFNLVFWGVMNKTGDWSGIMVNLPGGFYVKQSDAEVDADNFDVYSIPREFSIDSGTAFLIARATFQMGGTWSYVSTVDLRGLTPATASGSSVNDHGGLGGLTDDDHVGYLLVDGSRALSADWTTGVHSIIGSDHWYMRANSKLLYFGSGDNYSINWNSTDAVHAISSGAFEFNGGDLEPNKNLVLVNTTGANTFGIVTKGSSRFLHDFNYGDNGTVTTVGQNCFIGLDAGNLTMGSTSTETFHASFNVGIGYRAGVSLTDGFSNVLIGYQSGEGITTGYNNLTFGYQAGFGITTGKYNNVFGFQAGYSIDGGESNNVFGFQAGRTLANGNSNNVFGFEAGYSLTNGTGNNIYGFRACYGLTSGGSNTAFGSHAGRYITGGAVANTTGSNSLFFGDNTRAKADGEANQIVMGTNATGNGANTITLGGAANTDTYITAGNLHLVDNAELLLGTADDAKIYYNTTDLVIDPDAVGSGKVLIGATANNEIDAGSYSVGGSAGASGTFTTVDGKTVTATNGIITSIV